MRKLERMAERISPIISLFFSEFDNRAGPIITFEVPEGKFSSSGLFDQISSYIIPKPELMARQLTISSGPFKVVGYPIQIDDAKYARNALMFNLCFVFDGCANVSPYEPIVKKLGEYLRTAEVEANLISTESSKKTLPELMLRLLTDLNNLGRCSVELNKSSTLFLKVVPTNRNKSPAVHDFDVPILTSNFTSLAALEDLTTRQIVPLIDGVKNVHQISDEVDADPDLVKSCVQNMIFYNVCKVVPAFFLTNVYRVMPGIERLLFDSVLQRECLKTVTKAENDAPSIRDIMVLYGDMQIGITVKNLLTRHATVANRIDEKKLCDFGVMHGLISRVYKYPLYTRYNQTTTKANAILRWFDGAHHTDDILQKVEGTVTGQFTAADLDDKIEADQSVVVCWK